MPLMPIPDISGSSSRYTRFSMEKEVNKTKARPRETASDICTSRFSVSAKPFSVGSGMSLGMHIMTWDL